MSETINLANKIKEQLPAELLAFIRTAGETASGQGQALFLVGGAVRDLLLERSNFDLDLAVEGDAISFAQQLTPLSNGKITTHPRFGTAKLQWQRWSIDFTTARSETYARPGALPAVEPSTINEDLFRRDFTINAMAVSLTPSRYGELIDFYGGQTDLKGRLVRVLHDKSFTDDATRIWRALRYEQRLDFKLETSTFNLLKRDISMLDTISGDRIRYELECVLGEEYPEKTLRRAEELGVLPKLHPSLKGNGRLTEVFERARELTSPNPPPLALYLNLMAYHLTANESEELISYLKLPNSLALPLRDTITLKGKYESLADPRLTPSQVYRLLHDYYPSALTAGKLSTDSPAVSRQIDLYLNSLRYVKPALGGNDLIMMGVTPGPQIKAILSRLLEARLDGKVSDKQGEAKMVEGWLQTGNRKTS